MTQPYNKPPNWMLVKAAAIVAILALIVAGVMSLL